MKREGILTGWRVFFYFVVVFFCHEKRNCQYQSWSLFIIQDFLEQRQLFLSYVALASFGHGLDGTPHFSWNLKLDGVDMEHLTMHMSIHFTVSQIGNHSCSWHCRWIICAAASSGIYYPHYTCCLPGEIKKRLLSSQAVWLCCIQSSMAWPGGCVLLSGRFARFYKVIILIAPFLRKASQVLLQLQMTPAPAQRWKRKKMRWWELQMVSSSLSNSQICRPFKVSEWTCKNVILNKRFGRNQSW